MALNIFLLFAIFLTAQAQHVHLSDLKRMFQERHPQHNSNIRKANTEVIPLSYDPNQVCFNPQYYGYFDSNMLSTCPVPGPNIYYNLGGNVNDNSKESVVVCRNDRDKFFRKQNPQDPQPPDAYDVNPYFPYPPYMWNGYLPNFGKNFVPAVFFPTSSKKGQLDFRAADYAKTLKNTRGDDAVLTTKNKTFSRKPMEFKISDIRGLNGDGIPVETPRKSGSAKTVLVHSVRVKKEGKQMVSTTADPMEHRREVRRKQDEEAQKVINYLIDLGTTRKKMSVELNDEDKVEAERSTASPMLSSKATNVYPLPKFVHGSTEKTQPSTVYDRRQIFTHLDKSS